MSKMNILLFAAGSYNPPTHMHLRMFEIAKDFLHSSGRFHVLGGIVSPVHDDYKKESLSEANAAHRCAMLNLCLKEHPFVKLSRFETEQGSWTRLRKVLEEHHNLLSTSQTTQESLPWAPEGFNPQEPFKILFLCGADLLESFSVPGLWTDEDMEVIVKDFGLVVISREGADPQKFIYKSDMLTKNKSNIHIVTEWITNDISSTKVRRALRRHESVKYLIPDEVIEYISKQGLYGTHQTEYHRSLLDRPASPCLLRPLVVVPHLPCDMTSITANGVSPPLRLDLSNEEEEKDTQLSISSTSSSSSVQSQLSLIKSSSVIEGDLVDEAITPSEDEMSPLEKEFQDAPHQLTELLPPIQENDSLLEEEDEEEEEELNSPKIKEFSVEIHQEALILDEKRAVELETEEWMDEVADSAEFPSVLKEESFAQVREVESLPLQNVDVLEDVVTEVGESPKTLTSSPEATTDSLSNDELEKTVIEAPPPDPPLLLSKEDSVDFSELPPPPPLPYSESFEKKSAPSDENDDDNQYVLVNKEDKNEAFELPPDPQPEEIPPIKPHKKTPSKKSEDKVQIEITRKGIVVISEKESFL